MEFSKFVVASLYKAGYEISKESPLSISDSLWQGMKGYYLSPQGRWKTLLPELEVEHMKGCPVTARVIAWWLSIAEYYGTADVKVSKEYSLGELTVLCRLMHSYSTLDGNRKVEWFSVETTPEKTILLFDKKGKVACNRVVIEKATNQVTVDGHLVCGELHVNPQDEQEQVADCTVINPISAFTLGLLEAFTLLNANQQTNRRVVGGVEIFKKLLENIHVDQTPDHVIDHRGSRKSLVAEGKYLRTVKPGLPFALANGKYMLTSLRDVPQVKVAYATEAALKQGYVSLPKSPFTFIPLQWVATQLGAIKQEHRSQITTILGTDTDFVLAYSKVAKLQQGPRLGGAQSVPVTEEVQSPFGIAGMEPDYGKLLSTGVCPFAVYAPGKGMLFSNIQALVRHTGQPYQYDSFNPDKPLTYSFTPDAVCEEDGWVVAKYHYRFEGGALVGKSIAPSRNSVVASVDSTTINGRSVSRSVKAGKAGLICQIRHRIVSMYGVTRLEVAVDTITMVDAPWKHSVKLREWDTKLLPNATPKEALISPIDGGVDLIIPADGFKAYKNRYQGLIRTAVVTAQFNSKWGDSVKEVIEEIKDNAAAEHVPGTLLTWSPIDEQRGLYDELISKFRSAFYKPIWLIHEKDKWGSKVVWEEHSAREGWVKVDVPTMFADRPNAQALLWESETLFGVEGEQKELLVCWEDGWAQRTMSYIGNNEWGHVYTTQKVESTTVKDSMSISNVQEGNILSMAAGIGVPEALAQIKLGDKQRDVVALARSLYMESQKEVISLNNEADATAFANWLASLLPDGVDKVDLWDVLKKHLWSHIIEIPTGEGSCQVSVKLAAELSSLQEGSRNQMADLLVEYIAALLNGANPFSYEGSGVNMPLLARRLAGTLKSFAVSEGAMKLTRGGPSVVAKVMAHPQLEIGELAYVKAYTHNRPEEDTVCELIHRVFHNDGADALVGAARAPHIHTEVFKLRIVVNKGGEQFIIRDGKEEKLIYPMPTDMIAINPIAMAFNRGDFDGDQLALFPICTAFQETLNYSSLLEDLNESLGRSVFNSGSYWSDHFGVPSKTIIKLGGACSKEELVKTVTGAHLVLTEGVPDSYNLSVFVGALSALGGFSLPFVKVCCEVYESLLGGYSPGGFALWEFFKGAEADLESTLESISVNPKYAKMYQDAWELYKSEGEKLNKNKVKQMAKNRTLCLNTIAVLDSLIRGGKLREEDMAIYKTVVNLLEGHPDTTSNPVLLGVYKALKAWLGISSPNGESTPPTSSRPHNDNVVDVVAEVLNPDASVCIIGCTTVGGDEIPVEFYQSIDKMMVSNFKILVEDNSPASLVAQEYLSSKGYLNVCYNHTTKNPEGVFPEEWETKRIPLASNGGLSQVCDSATIGGLFVWDGNCTQTKNLIDKMKADGKFVRVITVTPTPQDNEDNSEEHTSKENKPQAGKQQQQQQQQQQQHNLVPDFLSDEQKQVIQLVLAKKPLIGVLGKPGTGKSTLIKALPAIANHMNYKLVVTATTGVAATLLSDKGIEASTVNSSLSLGKGDVLPVGENEPKVAYGQRPPITTRTLKRGSIRKTMNLHKETRGYYEGLIFVVDEISMADAKTLLVVYQLLERFLPGRYILLVSGDPKQLPPVDKEEPGTTNDPVSKFWQELTTYYRGKPLNTYKALWKMFDVVVLNKVHRTDNPEYIANLELLGNGVCTPYFTGLIVEDNKLLHKDAMHIFVSNSDTAEYNRKKLSEFPASSRKVFTGVFRNYTNLPDSYFLSLCSPIERSVELAVGARFMCRKNVYKEEKLILSNGSIGTITDFIVNDEGEEGIELLLDNGNVVNLFPQWLDMPVDENGNVMAHFKALPGHLAYAITGHKCQGMSLSKGSKIVVHPWLFKNGKATKPVSFPGWLYVVLSRNACIEDVQIACDFSTVEQTASMLCRAAVADPEAVALVDGGMSLTLDLSVGKAYCKQSDVTPDGCTDLKYIRYDVYYDAMAGGHTCAYVLKYAGDVVVDCRKVVDGKYVKTDDAIVSKLIDSTK